MSNQKQLETARLLLTTLIDVKEMIDICVRAKSCAEMPDRNLLRLTSNIAGIVISTARQFNIEPITED